MNSLQDLRTLVERYFKKTTWYYHELLHIFCYKKLKISVKHHCFVSFTSYLFFISYSYVYSILVSVSGLIYHVNTLFLNCPFHFSVSSFPDSITCKKTGPLYQSKNHLMHTLCKYNNNLLTVTLR